MTITKNKINIESLPEDIYNICFKKGTEPAFSGKYDKHFAKGKYYCACCDNFLFLSKHKYDSASGWPSFFEVEEDSVEYKSDLSHNMARTEISCANCDAHLGHVFDDGPEPTGKRYCINSLALNFHDNE